MAVLHNRVSQRELKENLHKEKESRVTISFYLYFPIDDPKRIRDDLYQSFYDLKVFGRIYVAREGINAQVSVPGSRLESFKQALNGFEGLHGLRLNIALDDDGKSFWVLKIKVRDKIVADGIQDNSFDMRNKGKYVNPEEFNRLADDPGTILVDMRNHYEFEVGHFANAVEIPADTFREQLPLSVDLLRPEKDKNIIMYCTGGIRCEKAGAYLKHHGFKNVFHLEGGIIHYANVVKEKGLDNKFLGKNFVFDERLGERIGEEIISRCHQCGKACDKHVNCRNGACHMLFIQCAECASDLAGCCSVECRDIVQLPQEVQKRMRTGFDKGRNIFNKSRQHKLSVKITERK